MDAQGAHDHQTVRGDFGVPIINKFYTAPNSTAQTINNVGSGGNADPNNHTRTDAAANHVHNLTIAATGGAETRPRNVALLYCIKT